MLANLRKLSILLLILGLTPPFCYGTSGPALPILTNFSFSPTHDEATELQESFPLDRSLILPQVLHGAGYEVHDPQCPPIAPTAAEDKSGATMPIYKRSDLLTPSDVPAPGSPLGKPGTTVRATLENELGSGVEGYVCALGLEDGQRIVRKVHRGFESYRREKNLLQFLQQKGLIGEVTPQYYGLDREIKDVEESESSEMGMKQSASGEGFFMFSPHHQSGFSLFMELAKAFEPFNPAVQHRINPLTAHGRNCIFQLVMLLKRIHSVGVAHCDIKVDNVLVVNRSGGEEWRYCDFGTAVILAADYLGNNETAKLATTDTALAPEFFTRQWASARHYQALDIWSLGVLLHQVFVAGRRESHPFQEEYYFRFNGLNNTDFKMSGLSTVKFSQQMNLFAINAWEYMPVPPSVAEIPIAASFLALLRGMLQLNPNKRRENFRLIEEHPYWETPVLELEEAPSFAKLLSEGAGY